MFGNHKLNLESYDSGIEELEKVFEVKIIDYRKGVKIPDKTTETFNKLKFWTNHKFHKIKFEENNWGIWLSCNHKSCDRIRIFKNVIDFTIREVNTRYNIWKDLISNQYEVKQKYSEYRRIWQRQVEQWKEFKSFATQVLYKVGGDTFIYLNDADFQDVEGDLWAGESFEKAIAKLSEKSEGIDYEELINAKDNSFEKMENWFIERVKKEASR